MASKTVQMKELRGNILRFLREIYDNTIAHASILESYYQYYKVDDIEDCIAYLVDKGYAVKKELKSPFASFEVSHIYKISTKGIDLLEGTIEDPGIFTKGV